MPPVKPQRFLWRGARQLARWQQTVCHQHVRQRSHLGAEYVHLWPGEGQFQDPAEPGGWKDYDKKDHDAIEKKYTDGFLGDFN